MTGTELYDKIFNKVELSSEQVNLKMDFSVIQKRVSSRLKELNKTHNAFLKLLPKLEQVKKDYDSMKGVGKFEDKELNKYYKDFDKKASELGIDTRSTQFYKEFLDVQDQVGQINDIIDDLKARL
jgi:hypothetical protein